MNTALPLSIPATPLVNAMDQRQIWLRQEEWQGCVEVSPFQMDMGALLWEQAWHIDAELLTKGCLAPSQVLL